MEAEKLSRTYAALPVVPQSENSKPFVRFKSEKIDEVILKLCKKLVSSGWEWQGNGELETVFQESKKYWEDNLGTFTKEVEGTKIKIKLFYFFPSWILRISISSEEEEKLDDIVEEYIEGYDISLINLINYEFYEKNPDEIDIEDGLIASQIGDNYLVKGDRKNYKVYFEDSFPDEIIRVLDITHYDLYQSSMFLENALKEWNERLENFSPLYEIKRELEISSGDDKTLGKYMDKVQDLLLELDDLEEIVKYCSHEVELTETDIEFYIEEFSEEPINKTGVLENLRNEAQKNVFLSNDLESFFEIIRRRHRNLMEFITSKLETKANRNTSDLNAAVKTLGVLMLGFLGGLTGATLSSSTLYSSIAAVLSLLVGYFFLERL